MFQLRAPTSVLSFADTFLGDLNVFLLKVSSKRAIRNGWVVGCLNGFYLTPCLKPWLQLPQLGILCCHLELLPFGFTKGEIQQQHQTLQLSQVPEADFQRQVDAPDLQMRPNSRPLELGKKDE